MRRWLKATHGPFFELLRHFLLRFFDSELVTHPGQMAPVLIGALPLVFQWFFLLIPPLAHKYVHLRNLPVRGPYLDALRADELWLITLMMSVIGLLTAIKWQSLFPDLRDYRVLGTLPLRPVQIFGAKLTALLLVAAAALVAINFLPTFGFPALTHSPLAPHAIASVAGCCFFFFGLVALQGVLLNLLRPRAFGRVTGSLQGLLVGVMLGLVVMSFSIEPRITGWLIGSVWGRWLPPVWFLGLYQTLAGDAEPVLANRATIGLECAVVLALLSYLVSYQRHRTLLLETGRARRRWLIAGPSRSPRQQAVTAFMMHTIGRSSYHRTIMLAYGGLGFALLVTGLAALKSATADFVYYHLLAVLLLLAGSRHLFSRPIELKANWIFQIMERDGRIDWMRAMDRLVLVFGAAPLILLPLPFELHLLGMMRGLAEVALLTALGLLAYEWTFFHWNKLPFTCSHLPGRTPIWIVLGTLGLLGALGLLHSALVAALNSIAWFPLLVGLVFIWARVRIARRQNWEATRLKFEEAPDVEVEALSLLR